LSRELASGHKPRACGGTPTPRLQERQAYIGHKADGPYLDRLHEEHDEQLGIELQLKGTTGVSDSPSGLHLVLANPHIDNEFQFGVLLKQFGALALEV
jgi:hypothetical protein